MFPDGLKLVCQGTGIVSLSSYGSIGAVLFSCASFIDSASTLCCLGVRFGSALALYI